MYVIMQKANLIGLTQGYRRKATISTNRIEVSTVTVADGVSDAHHDEEVR